MLGRCYLETGLVEKAQAVYQRGIKLFPTYPLFNFGLGRIAQMNNDFASAKEFYYRTIKYSPDYGPAYDLLARIYNISINAQVTFCCRAKAGRMARAQGSYPAILQQWAVR
ncbi:MAG: hypothetical protein NT002_08005 [candidate division Zixibacteria bacterium]|nr:hypothetical protein [candidate division Zixibacteria bacterium]